MKTVIVIEEPIKYFNAEKTINGIRVQVINYKELCDLTNTKYQIMEIPEDADELDKTAVEMGAELRHKKFLSGKNIWINGMFFITASGYIFDEKDKVVARDRTLTQLWMIIKALLEKGRRGF